MTPKTMETKREAFGDDEAARELAQDVASLHDEPYEPHAPNGDPQDEPEEQDDDNDHEPDGRWVFVREAGCWTYE
jgi:hypothetical protein